MSTRILTRLIQALPTMFMAIRYTQRIPSRSLYVVRTARHRAPLSEALGEFAGVLFQSLTPTRLDIRG